MPLGRTALLFFILIGLHTAAQKGEEDCFGTWAVVSGDHRISEKLSIPTVGVLRHYELFQHYEFAFVRTGLTYRFNGTLSGTVGYAYLDSEPFIISPEAKGAQQHWLYEELVLKSTLGNLNLSHRYRLESRWILKTEGTILRHRMRYRLQLKYPMGKRLYANLYNEVFVAFQEPLFNQNRLHLGLAYVVCPSLRFEVGYLKNHFPDIHCDRIRLGLVFKTDWTKKKKR
ncbi:DUF2490 domain-containing protein [Flavobacteriaceae bacterium TP-CH-4]|uniref:DUF2490 domain-containing protein n=1 Tax=Pelagihabitans pacificus TaxID=2696054 RepID=A0A967E5H6_9FLAO|nr:DUF2490 domain-containing protein [Pelagihabitans pacificus]NHF59447.1 DUF2490 domain-containing protein [Pelagihabitans pacificus]